MTGCPLPWNHDKHGNRCSCRLLANVIDCDSWAIRFTCCHAVLMKRWVMECTYGSHNEIVESVRSAKWHDIGPINPISAILIRNG